MINQLRLREIYICFLFIVSDTCYENTKRLLVCSILNDLHVNHFNIVFKFVQNKTVKLLGYDNIKINAYFYCQKCTTVNNFNDLSFPTIIKSAAVIKPKFW